MDCKCADCGFWFFLEEGYEPATDMIVCPMCGKETKAND